MSFGNTQRHSMSRPRCDVQIRWMIRRDMSEVLDIERQSFEFAWSEEDFLCCLRQRNCIGMVAERQERIVGFMIYELLKSQLHVLNFAVAPWARRQSVGAQMVEKLVNKLSQQRRQEICLEVRERNLPAQLFFRSQGLQAHGVLRNHYEDTEEDAYVMRYQLYPCDEQILPFAPKNRIAEIDNDSDAEAA
jgi:[ribosomal protein S18]-alanine N-acetyltransferase